uniref:Uncharacterized protein n=1 Tax=Anguilla anguilla TaxID=7936 RepID=A0A0E9VM33_ANGAN
MPGKQDAPDIYHSYHAHNLMQQACFRRISHYVAPQRFQ